MNSQIIDERNTDLWLDVARGIFEEHCILDKRGSETGAGFVLAQSRGTSKPPLSPYYVNLRARPEGKMSDELIQKSGLLLLRMMIKRKILQRILVAGVPNAGNIFARVITERSSAFMSILPMSRELREFSVGAPEKTDWRMVVPVENVVTSGESLILTIEAIRKAGFSVNDAFVLVEREDTAMYRLLDMGVKLHVALTIKDLLDFGVNERFIPQAFRDECLAFRSFR